MPCCGHSKSALIDLAVTVGLESDDDVDHLSPFQSTDRSWESRFKPNYVQSKAEQGICSNCTVGRLCLV